MDGAAALISRAASSQTSNFTGNPTPAARRLIPTGMQGKRCVWVWVMCKCEQRGQAKVRRRRRRLGR